MNLNLNESSCIMLQVTQLPTYNYLSITKMQEKQQNNHNSLWQKYIFNKNAQYCFMVSFLWLENGLIHSSLAHIQKS